MLYNDEKLIHREDTVILNMYAPKYGAAKMWNENWSHLKEK